MARRSTPRRSRKHKTLALANRKDALRRLFVEQLEDRRMLATITFDQMGSVDVTEGSTTHDVAVTLDEAPTVVDAKVTLTPSNAEIDLGSGAGVAVELTFPVGTATLTQMVTVAAFNDTEVEGSHSALVTPSNTTAAGSNFTGVGVTGGAATANITDNDIATFTIDNVAVNEDGSSLDFTLSLDNPIDTAADVVVSFADVSTEAGDFTHTAQTIGFGALDTADKTVSVPINNDNIVELLETFTAGLAISGGTPLGDRSVDTSGTGTGTINASDTATISIAPNSADKLEGTGGTTPFTFDITLDNPSEEDITVLFTVNDGASGPGLNATVSDGDYTDQNGVLVTFTGSPTGGDQSETITIDVTGDDHLENDEVFGVVISDPKFSGGTDLARATLGTASAVGTIQDDDTDLKYNSTDGEDFELRMLPGGTMVRVLIDGTAVGDFPAGVITSFTFDDTSVGGEDNTLILDMTNGLLGFDVNFFAGDGTDDIDLTGGAADTVTFRYDSLNDGSIAWANGTSATLNYTGLDPIASTLTAAHVVLDFFSGAEAITVSDGGGVVTTVSSTAGELTMFPTPTTTLTINTEPGGHTAGADTISLTGIGDGFTMPGAAFNINAGTDDDINVDGTIDIGAGDFDFTGDDISFAGGGSLVTTGDVTLTADTAGDGTIISGGNAGEVTANDLVADAADGITLDTNVDTIDASVSGTGDIDIDETDGVTLTSVTTADGFIDVTADGLVTATSVIAGGTGAADSNGLGPLDAGDISIVTTTGNVLVGLVDASSDDLAITAAGAIEELGADGAADLVGEDILLRSATGIGTVVAAIEVNAFGTSGDGLDAEVSGTGPINVTDVSGSIIVKNATTADGGVTLGATDGNMTILGFTAAGNVKIAVPDDNVTIDGAIVASDGGTTEFDVDIDPVDVTVNANISATGDVDITASNNIDVTAGVTIEADSDDDAAGDLGITADDDLAGGGDLTAVDTTSLIGASVDLQGFNVTVDVVSGKSSDVLLASDNDTTLNDDVSAVGGDVIVNAGLPIANDGVGDLVQVGGNISATGDVFLDADNTVDLDGTIGMGVPVGGDVSIQTDAFDQGTVTIDGDISADGAVLILASLLGADVLIDSGAIITADANDDGDDLVILADRDVTQSSGSLISNEGGIFVAAGFFSLVDGSASIVSAVADGPNQSPLGPITDANASGDAVIQIAAIDDVTVSGVVSTGGDVEIFAGTGDIFLGDIDAGANTVFIEAQDVLDDADDGAVIDANGGATNVTAAALAIDANEGIGSAGPDFALETTVSTFAASNLIVGDILIDNSGALSIGTVGDRIGVLNVDDDGIGPFGVTIITTASPLTVDDDVISAGAITLTAFDSAAAGDDLTVATADTAGTGSVDIVSNFGSVTLNAGDNLTIPSDDPGSAFPAIFTPVIEAGAMTSGAGNDININVDNASTRIGADPDVGVGSMVFVGDQTLFVDDPSQVGPGPFVDFVNSANISGGDDNDTFELFPQEDMRLLTVPPNSPPARTVTGAPIVLDGNPPIVGGVGVPPGDTLIPNFTSLVAQPPTLLLGPDAGSGEYSFVGPEAPLRYFSIETVTSDFPFHLVLDLDVTNFEPDGVTPLGPDVLLQLDAASSENLEIYVGARGVDFPAAAPTAIKEVFEGDIDDILSLQIYGDSAPTPNSVTIDDQNGLPVLADVLPTTLQYGAPRPDNGVVSSVPASIPSIFFDGRGGLGDALYYELSGGDTDQIYGLGDGAGGGFGADVGTAQGEILTIDSSPSQVSGLANETHQVLYFTGLEPITTSGTPGGTLTVLGDLENQLIQVMDAEDSTLTPAAIGPDYTRVQAYNENRDVIPWRFAPYEFLDFESGAFATLVLDGLGGEDIIDIISFDGTEALLDEVNVVGGDGNDIVSVITNTNTAGTVFDIGVMGEGGDDETIIGAYGAGNRVGEDLNRATATTHTLDAIDTTLAIRVLGGAGGADLLRIDDSEEPTGHTYSFVAGTVNPLGVERDGGLVADYGSVEAVELNSGTDGDLFEIGAILPPGGVTTIVDEGSTPVAGPNDRIDFTTFLGGAVTWDMDSAAQQSLGGLMGGAQLRVIGRIEDFTGSPADDTVFVDPATDGTPRDLLGGAPDPGDTLFFDPLGETVTDDGSGTITFTGGLGDITHAGFTSPTGANAVFADGELPPARIIDDSDGAPAFVASGGFAVTPNLNNHLGGANTDDTPNSGDEATWTFSDIPNGFYSVALTWDVANTAVDSPFTIHDGATSGDPVVGGKIVNQNQSVGSDPFVDAGSEWVTIDFVNITDNALTVSLTDAVTDRPEWQDIVQADAVRIDMLSPGIVIDNGDAGFAPGGFTEIGLDSHRGRLGDVHVAGPGAPATASWVSDPLPAGTYRVSTSYVNYNAGISGDVTTTGYDLAAPFSVNGQPAVFINQEIAPHLPVNSFSTGGMGWTQLDTTTIAAGGTITVELSNAGVTKSVAADAILIEPIGSVELNGGALVDGGVLTTFGSTRLGENVTRTVTVTNTGLGHLNLDDLVVDGVHINQVGITTGFKAPSGLQATSLPPGASTTFDVEMNADRIGNVVGEVSFVTDAFDPKVEFGTEGVVNERPEIIDDFVTNTSGGTFSAGGFGFAVGSGGLTYRVVQHQSAGGLGNVATWDFSPIGLADGTYQVATAWTPGANRATDANFAITGSAVTVVPPVNQELAPVGFISDGVTWQVLANVEVVGGTLTVTLDDSLSDPGQFVIADAIRVQRVDRHVVDQVDELALVDDGDPDFSVTGGTPVVHYVNNDLFNDDTINLGPADSAEWRFHVDPGFYEVGVTWDGLRPHATDVFYTISSPGRAPEVIGPIDQNDFTSIAPLTTELGNVGGGNGEVYQILTMFEVPALSKMITISVGGSATGSVSVDSAFVRRLSDQLLLPLTVDADSSIPANGGAPITEVDLNMAVDQAVQAWKGNDLNDGQLRDLSQLDVRLASIPGSTLGLASPNTGRVFIDQDLAGFGAGAFDLVFVVQHEIGHILGYDDDHHFDDHHFGDVMGATLSPFTTRSPLGSLSDAALADSSLLTGLFEPSLREELSSGDLLSEDDRSASALVSDIRSEEAITDQSEPTDDSLLWFVERERREVDAVFGELGELEEDSDDEDGDAI